MKCVRFGCRSIKCTILLVKGCMTQEIYGPLLRCLYFDPNLSWAVMICCQELQLSEDDNDFAKQQEQAAMNHHDFFFLFVLERYLATNLEVVLHKTTTLARMIQDKNFVSCFCCLHQEQVLTSLLRRQSRHSFILQKQYACQCWSSKKAT